MNLDTDAIQAAIDQVAASGGGRVSVPPGRYLSGTIRLKDGIDLHLEKGAVLIGSPHREDYNDDDHLAADPPLPFERVSAAHLIMAVGVSDVSVTGQGSICGNADAFMEPTQYGAAPESYRYGRPKREIGAWRPAQMLFFFQCSDVTVTGVRLLDATYWTVYLFDCDRVHLSDLTITNPADTPNGDGIDIVSCRTVAISNCLIRSGDDCLVFRTRSHLVDHDPICSDVVVTNCTLSSPTAGIRVGVADGTVRRVIVSNCVISQARTGILVVARYSEAARHGATVEDIHFRDLVMEVAVPFSIGAGLAPVARPAAIRDLSIVGCQVVSTAAGQLVGSPEVPIERLTIRDVTWRVRGGSDNDQYLRELPDPIHGRGFGGFPAFDGEPTLPAALWATHTDQLHLDGLTVHWEEPAIGWRSAVEITDSTEVRLSDVVAADPHDPSRSGIRLDRTTLRV